MHASRVFVRSIRGKGGCLALAVCGFMPVLTYAQGTPTPHDQHPPPPVNSAPKAEQPERPAQDHSQHGAAATSRFPAREASGTAWLPDGTPMYGILTKAGGWELMWHGNAFAQYLYESGDRGSDQAGSINWIMGMARRDVAGGRFGVRGMVSLEPWTIRGCGYPDLLATGELCNGGTIHDRQHPHDLFMELGLEYDRPLRGSARWSIYGGPAGEPALGPVAFPHRLSAMANPLAPISHHWLDATHITFGVVTAGMYDGRWKAEGSAFNGREPDEHRRGFDLAALDSLSGRIWFLPSSSWALQVSAGRLTEAEPGHEGGARIDVDRLTASVTYHRSLVQDSIWATTVAWGQNREEGESTNALLAETNVTLRERHALFGRLEVAEKSAHDLDIRGTDEVFTVAKLQAGYTRYFGAWKGLKPGLGGGVSLGFVPERLKPAYGNRVTPGFSLFVTLRPGPHRM